MKGLILTYVVTVLASIGALQRPVIGLYVYVAFAVLRPQFVFGWAGDMQNISLAVGVALLVGWALKGFGSWRVGRGAPVLLMLLVFTAWTLLSASMAEFQDASTAAVIELLKIVLPFCAGVTLLDGERDWRRLMWTIVLAQAYVGFEMNLNYVRGFNQAAEGFGGMDNNCFGVALVTIFGCAIALVLTSRRWYGRALAAVAAALILHTTLLTFSRGAMVGMVAVGAAAFLALPKRPTYIAVMLVAALLAVRLTGPQLLARYGTVLASDQERDGSAQSRLDLWRDTVKVIQMQPMLGVGPANWRHIAYRFGWPAGKSAHSVWMESAAEIGVPGTLALLAFFVVAIVRLWPLARQRITDANRAQVGAAMGVMLGSIGFIVSGQFVSVVGLEAPYYVVLVGVALLRQLSTQTAAALVPASTASMGEAPLLAVSRVQPARAPRPAYRPTGRRLLPDLGTRR